jgi:hypothetical protein
MMMVIGSFDNNYSSEMGGNCYKNDLLWNTCNSAMPTAIALAANRHFFNSKSKIEIFGCHIDTHYSRFSTFQMI